MIELALSWARVASIVGILSIVLICMSLYMFLQVLGTLEFFPACVTDMRFERDVHTNVRGDVVALDSSSATATPATCQVEVVGRAASDVPFTHMLL